MIHDNIMFGEGADVKDFGEENVVAEWRHEGGLSVKRKGRKRSWEMPLSGAGVYVIHARTSSKALPLARNVIRYTELNVAVVVPKEEGSNFTHFSETLNGVGRHVAIRFSVPDNASIIVSLDPHALVTPMTVDIQVVRRIKSSEEGEGVVQTECLPPKDEENLSHMERKFLDVASLPSDERELIHSQEDSWPSLEVSDLTCPMEVAEERMARNSWYKDAAYHKGLIRPFLLLVSMHPTRRLRWACALKADYREHEFYGDCHAEAYHMLTKDRHGIQGRANHCVSESLNPLSNDVNWHQVLHRVGTVGMKRSKKVEKETRAGMKDTARKHSFSATYAACLDPRSTDVARAEELYTIAVCQVILFVISDTDAEEYERVREAMLSVDNDEYVAKLKECGYENEDVMRFLCWVSRNGGESYIFQWLERWAKKKKEGNIVGKGRIVLPACLLAVSFASAFFLASTPLFFLPLGMLLLNIALFAGRATPGKLIIPLVAICLQRYRLAVRGVRIEDYYPSL